MRVLPRSLFGRLMMTLILGLILIQFISAGLLLRDRHKFLRERMGLNVIDRVVAAVNLLESTPRENRPLIIRALHSPDFRVSLTNQPRPAPPEAEKADNLEFVLGRRLPNHNQVQVSIEPFPFGPRYDFDDQARENGHDQRHWFGPMGHPERFGPGPFRFKPVGFEAQVQLSDGQWVGFSRPLPESIYTWPKRLFLTLIILLLLLVGISLLVVRQMTRPLNSLAKAADDLGRNIDSPPIAEKGTIEVQKASRAFNTMQARLKRFINDRSQVLAAVSHDLKTPITRLRLRTELLEDEKVKQQFEADLSEMEHMVMATLDYMRGTESGEKSVDFDPLALLEALQDDLSELGWPITIRPAACNPYPGRPMALKRCLGNLIENAVKYGRQARVSLHDSDELLTIVITDQGPGYEGDLEELFNPFFRAEKSRSKETGGTGLGLGIARNIARAHGGDVVLRRGGKAGLEAVVTLPR